MSYVLAQRLRLGFGGERRAHSVRHLRYFTARLSVVSRIRELHNLCVPVQRSRAAVPNNGPVLWDKTVVVRRAAVACICPSRFVLCGDAVVCTLRRALEGCDVVSKQAFARAPASPSTVRALSEHSRSFSNVARAQCARCTFGTHWRVFDGFRRAFGRHSAVCGCLLARLGAARLRLAASPKFSNKEWFHPSHQTRSYASKHSRSWFASK